MLTNEEVRSALSARGIDLPDFEIDLLMCTLVDVSNCLIEHGVSECKQNTILLLAVILLSANTSGRRLQSQSTPSGSSRSFEHGSKPWLIAYNQLKKLDEHGCTSGIIASPDETRRLSFFGVFTGT